MLVLLARLAMAGAIGVSNFWRAFFMVSLNSWSSRSMKQIPRNLLALSSFGFSCDHFCLSFSWAFFLIVFQSSGHRWIWPGCQLPFCQSLTGHIYYLFGGFSSNREIWVKPVQESDKSLDPSIFQWSSMRRSCITSKVCMGSSGDVNVFQWNKEWFFSRRIKFDSGFNMKAVYEVSWHGPKIIHRFTSIRKRVVRWWRWRPFWFSKKISLTFSSNWVAPYKGSQFLISSNKFYSSICNWKMILLFFFVKYYFLCIESFWVDFRCVHRLQLLEVCNNYVTLPNSTRVQSVSKNILRKTFFPNWWILDWSFAVIGWYSTNEPNGMIGPLNGCPKRLSQGVFPSNNRSVTFRR